MYVACEVDLQTPVHRGCFCQAGKEHNDKLVVKILACNPGDLNTTPVYGQASGVTFMNSHGGWGMHIHTGIHMCIRDVNTSLHWGMTRYSPCSTTSTSAKPGMASASLHNRVNVGRLPLMVVALHSCRGDRRRRCFTGKDTVQRQKCTQTSKLSVMHNPPGEDLFLSWVLSTT